jgi:hypothetical protein
MVTMNLLSTIGLLTRIITEQGYSPIKWTLTVEDRSPWTCFDIIRIDPHDASEPHEWRFAVWNETGLIYVVDSYGAVGEDPITVPTLEKEREWLDAMQWRAPDAVSP